MQEIKQHLTLKNIIFLILTLIIIKFIAEVKDLALLVFASFVIAASLNPLVDKLQKYMKRSAATIISLILFIALILGALVPLVLFLLDEIDILFSELPHKIDLVKNIIATKAIFGTKLSTIINMNTLPGASTEFMGSALQKTISASATLVGAIAVMFIVTMIVFYMLNDKERMKTWFLSLFPQNIRAKAQEVTGAITIKVGGFVIAQSTAMLSVGIVTTIGLLLLGIPYALALGLLAGILDIIPIVGPVISTLIGISAGYTKGWGIVCAIIMVYIIAQWISNNVIRPLIFGKFMDLHPLVILLSFLIAAKFLDVWGVILAPAIAAVFCVLFDELYIKQINKTQPSEDVKVEE